MLFATFAILAFIAAGMMLLPLRRFEQVTADRETGAMAVLEDQLREVDKDAARGLISDAEAKAAKVEIKRRILKVARTEPTARVGGTTGRAALWASALVVPVFAALLYGLLGSPAVPGMAFTDRQEERAERKQMAELTGRLLDRLQSDPDGGPLEGWMLLGQTYMRMGRYADAASAMKNVIGRDDATSAVLSQYAEALIAVDDGTVTPKARDIIRRAREMDPGNPAAAYYEAIALDQAGDSEEAHDLLVTRLDRAGGPAPWMEVFIAQANRIGEGIGRDPVSLLNFAPMATAAPGPTAEDVAAASEMSDTDRSEFIRSMVDRLADRLADEPADLDGWLRLGSAYRVLGETAKARDAYKSAEKLASGLPDGDPRNQTIRDALSKLKE